MNVTEAVQRRVSVRAFNPDAVPGEIVSEILKIAGRAPSRCNVQPWRVYALAGQPLKELKSLTLQKMADGEEGAVAMEPPEYQVFPPKLWEPYRTHRFVCGEDLYATIEVSRDDKAGRRRHLARNLEFFGAPVGLFFSLDRNLLPPQWADVGMCMQNVMLLAIERGLDTCAQEFWALMPRTVGSFIGLPQNQMLFSGMALGYRDDAAPINTLRTRRDPLEAFVSMKGFADATTI